MHLAPSNPDTFLTLAREIVEGQQAARARHVGGVCYSALGPIPPEVEAVEEVASKLRQDAELLRLWLASPRGRFYSAVGDLEGGGFIEEAYRLRGLYTRSLADEREPLNVAAVGAALAILSPIRVAYAREAIDALSELLMSDAGDRRVAA